MVHVLLLELWRDENAGEAAQEVLSQLVAEGARYSLDLAARHCAVSPDPVEGEHRAVIGPPQHRALLSPAAMRRTSMAKGKKGPFKPIGTVPPVGGVPTRPKPRKRVGR
jgi:hypothetical protein